MTDRWQVFMIIITFSAGVSVATLNNMRARTFQVDRYTHYNMDACHGESFSLLSFKENLADNGTCILMDDTFKCIEEDTSEWFGAPELGMVEENVVTPKTPEECSAAWKAFGYGPKSNFPIPSW